jgi:hypothetical protein
MHGLVETLEARRPEIDKFKQVAHELPSQLRHNHRTGVGHALQPSGEIRGFAYHRPFARLFVTHEVANNHETCSDPDPGRKNASNRRLDSRNRIYNGETTANGALSLVFVCGRPTEIGEDSVPHELRYMPFETRDLPRNGILIGAQDVAQDLRIDLSRQRRGSDEVAEHDGKLSPFTFAAPLRGFGLHVLGRGMGLVQPGNRCRYDPPRPKWQAKFFEIALGQMWQRLESDLVVDKKLGIFAQAEPLQPRYDVRRRC